jgi:hypothetical protein
MPEIKMVGSNPTVRWFRDPILKIGDDAHGYRLLGIIKDPASNISRGGLWLQISSKSLRMDNGNATDSSNKLMTDKYPATLGVGYSKAVVSAAPGVLKAFVGMLKGLQVFLPPTALIKDKDGNVLPGYEGVTTVGTVTLEAMMDLPSTSVRAPSTRKAAASVVSPTRAELEAQLKVLEEAEEAMNPKVIEDTKKSFTEGKKSKSPI